MVLDDLRTYLQMASGITEATTAKAREVVSGLLASGLALTTRAVPSPDVVGQVQELADDLVATSRNNRELLTGVIRTEVDKAVGRMGFVREDELAALRRHVQRLQAQVTELQDRMGQPGQASSATEPAEASGGTEPAEASGGTESAEASSATEPAKKKKVIVEPQA